MTKRLLGRTFASTSVLLVLASASGVAALSLVSVEQEIAIGQQAQQEIRNTVPELRDEAVTRYIDDIGRRLVAHAPGAKYPYSFSVANYKELNAFALPGGPVWVHRGAMAAARTEAQLAGVMAHEVAHIAERHAAAQITKQTVAGALLDLLGGALDNGGRAGTIARIGAGVGAQGLFMKFSRDDERDADRVGTTIMRNAGWDPHGLVEFMEILRDQQQRSPGSVEVFLSSHPSPASRVEELRVLAGASAGGRRDSDAFHAMQRRLSALPAAQAMPRS